MIEVKFYGTRGSIPVCDPHFQQFGGNTSCVGLKIDGQLVIVDAGTGIRELGKELQTESGDIDILFTHFHWDHIQGFPFFEPCYNSGVSLNLSTVDMMTKDSFDLHKALSSQMSSSHFPIGLKDMPASLNFLPKTNLGISGIELNHPGGCKGFKIRSKEGKTLAYMVDHEHTSPLDKKYINFCKDVDILIHDAQYTTTEHKKYQGWGHSSYQQALDLAEKAQVKQLIFTHHDPDHNDEFLLRQELKCQIVFNNCLIAREGMTIRI